MQFVDKFPLSSLMLLQEITLASASSIPSEFFLAQLLHVLRLY